MTRRAPNLAQEIIERYGIAEPDDIILHAIAYDLGIMIMEKPISGAEGRLVSNHSNGIIVVNLNIPEPGKKRFVMAHEIGHFELHRKIQRMSICDNDAFVDWHKNRPHETEANEFAAELLMPYSLFRHDCESDAPSIDLIKTLANKYNTTLTSTAIRFVEVGWFPLLLVCSENKRIKWFRKSSDFNYWPYQRGTEINQFNCASQFFEKGTVPKNPEMVLSKAWFEDQKITDKYFFEHCIILPRYNSVLSLVWESEI